MDGDPDLITTNKEKGNFLRMNDGTGKFTSLGPVLGKSRVFCIECKDLDGDKDLDVILGQIEGSGGNSIYFNESITN